MSKVKETLKERGSTHGSFSESSMTVQRLKLLMYESPNWNKMSAAQRDALEMVQHKIGRILYGDFNFLDSFRDIAGYAQLAYDDMASKDGTTDVRAVKLVRRQGKWEEQ